MTAVGSALAGDHHVTGVGEHREGLLVSQLTEFKGTEFVAPVVASTSPPQPPPSLRARYKAIGSIVEISNISEIDEGFKLERSAVAVIAACVFYAVVQVKVAAFHNHPVEAAYQQKPADEVFVQACRDVVS